MRTLFSRENRLLVLLAVAEATLLLDRLAVGFLAPFIGLDLHLNNLELGLLSSLFSLSFAISAYVVSGSSDRSGNRWWWLIALILLFSIASAAGGLSNNFMSLAALRVVLGALEGPFLPIALALMVDHSTPRRRSFNLAFVQNVGAFLFAQLCGPIILVWFAVNHGWRAAFFFTAVPGLIIGLLMVPMMRVMPNVARSVAPVIDTGAATCAPVIPLSLLSHRNIRLCAAIAACMGSWILLQMTFLPKYLVQVAGMTPTHMSWVMSLVGIGGCASSLILPLVSDRVGRRAALVAGTLIAILTPAGVLFATHTPAVLTISILLGSVALGTSPLYTAIIPSDTVGSAAVARVIALVAACSAIFGGILAPTIAGRLADSYGLGVAFWMAGGLALLATLLSLMLKPATPAA